MNPKAGRLLPVFIVSGLTPEFIRFYSGMNGGGFTICFIGTPPATCQDGLGTYGAALYSGMTSSPTLSTGAFTSDEFGVIVGGTFYEQPNTTIDATAVPEPSILLPLAAAILLLAALRGLALRLNRPAPSGLHSTIP